MGRNSCRFYKQRTATITDALYHCNAAPSAGIHAVNAIVNEGLNRDLIEPPQPLPIFHPDPLFYSRESSSQPRNGSRCRFSQLERWDRGGYDNYKVEQTV